MDEGWEEELKEVEREFESRIKQNKQSDKKTNEDTDKIPDCKDEKL